MSEEQCPYLERCPMFSHLASEGTKTVMVTLYCEGNYDACARKKIRDEGTMPDPKLLPTGSLIERTLP